MKLKIPEKPDWTPEQIKERLLLLTPREEQVLRLRWGLDGSPPMSLDAIGKRFGVTSARVRQIQNKALKKMMDKEVGDV